MPAKKWFAPEKNRIISEAIIKRKKECLNAKAIMAFQTLSHTCIAKQSLNCCLGLVEKSMKSCTQYEVCLKGFATNSIMMHKQLQTHCRFGLRRIDGWCDDFDFHRTVWTVTDGSVEPSFSLVGITSMHGYVLCSCENL